MKVLVTGATGNLGVEVAAGLARQGHAVVATVHARRSFVRNDGQPLAGVAECDADSARPGEIAAVPADLSLPAFGLPAADYDAAKEGACKRTGAS